MLILKYKRIDKKVRPVPATLPEEYHTICRIPEDPLLSLPLLPTHPPDFSLGECLTQERLDKLNLNTNNFLWPEELKLVQHVLKLNELALAWTEAEKGRFCNEYFSPVKILVVEHVPWVLRLMSLHVRRRGARMKMKKKKMKVVSAVCRPKGVTAQRLVLRALF